MLLEHGNVMVQFYDFVASVATIIAMDVKSIVMGDFVWLLVHYCYNRIDELGINEFRGNYANHT